MSFTAFWCLTPLAYPPILRHNGQLVQTLYDGKHEFDGVRFLQDAVIMQMLVKSVAMHPGLVIDDTD